MALPIMAVAGAVTAAMVKRRKGARRRLAARHHVSLGAWLRRWLARLARRPQEDRR